MRKLNQEKIASVIWGAKYDFLNRMFVMSEEDVKVNSKNRIECLGIVIPVDLLRQYIERWFECLTTTNELEKLTGKNRLVKNVTFRTVLRTYMKQLDTKQIFTLIQTGSTDFLNTMFVMTEYEIKNNSATRYEYCGIFIPDDLLQQYIAKLFECLTKTREFKRFIDKNRPLTSVAFRNDLCKYRRQLNTEKITSLICNANTYFLNKMFVMTEKDIKYVEENRHECFVIVIPDDLLQQYIERWFDKLTKTRCVEKFLDNCRPLNHVPFRTALHTYSRRFNTEKISSLVQTGGSDFLNAKFVMTQEEIEENAENRCKWFGIVIPGDLLQQYISRWFECLTKTSELEKFLNKNRLLTSVTFRTALCNYRKQLNTEEIASLICNANKDFLNKMIVMTEKDIKDVEENMHISKYFVFVIPDDLLQQYIGKWFNNLTQTRCVEKFLDNCRPLKHVPFRTALRTYMRQFNTEKISFLVQIGGSNFLNTMFVMTEEDIIDDAENEYKCFGIVIPDEILQQYIYRWIVLMSLRPKTECFFVESRPLTNITFCFALRTYIKKLNEDTIDYLIETGSMDFLNRMFFFTEDEIKDNGDNRHECFGIVISDNISMLQHYIENWFDCVTVANSIKECMNANRPLMNVKFRNVVRTFLRQLKKEEIFSIIDSAEDDFINKMFVMSQEDIDENAENRCECFGIVIPDESFLLQQYIARWFNGLKDADFVKECIHANRLLMNVNFRAALRTYTRQLDVDKIGILIQTCSSDFLNTMFVRTEKS